MDRACHKAIFKAKEDRISNLPDEVIHHIMSFLDIKDSIRTSKLSRRWRNIWTSMPHLNITSRGFRMWAKFAKFVRQVLSHRNNLAQVSTVSLIFTRVAIHAFENILRYAYSHNVQQLKVVWLSEKSHEFPQFIFSSHTLKHLTLVYSNSLYSGCSPRLPESAWDFPALETLTLRNIHVGYRGDKNLDLFSKCVNLKNITLDGYFSHSLEVFNICAPQLTNLTIKAASFAKVFNVVAPRLENLKLSVYATSRFNFSKDDFVSLEKVHITLSSAYYTKEYVPVLLDLLQQLRTVKFLTLDVDVIERLLSSLDQHSHEPCPLHDLRCLKINTSHVDQKDHTGSIYAQIRKYFLENSPSASLILNLPKPTPVHRTTTGACCLCPSYHNRHLLPRVQLSVTPVRRAPSPVGSPSVRISNIHHTAGVQSSFRPPVQRQLSPRAPPPPSGPQNRMSCPIHGTPAKVAKLEVEEKRMLGAKSQMHELIEMLMREKEAFWQNFS
ncbi:F-box domain, cyclin-like protein [Artemisia annua]|uniref:F-box domain, cyclin-like protein n=1 Tax=Artemisia annua TaxID=35608 RepID=A0A2U1N6T2_ARTAN|nr:F-box domain, cyclin-like protein [Artemisia annua]